jgi:hypothetical protein
MAAGLSPNQDLFNHAIGVYILENSIPRPVGDISRCHLVEKYETGKKKG